MVYLRDYPGTYGSLSVRLETDGQPQEQMTGVGNAVILENLKRIDEREKPIWIRGPLIPGTNDSVENLREVAAFTKSLRNVEKISLLSYNGAAGAKYSLIGRKYRLEYLDRYTKQEKNSHTQHSKESIP